ncbi:MAG: hypothetical protein KatS3mg050_2840 [Litorilinea sp.]|nr:MAG: hypothetical protein KatS3mg050_2840 [Litorilinea sp.]
MTCQESAGRPHLTVAVDASTYARWTLQWADADRPLTGDETLYLRAERTGTLTPNLYLVEREGRRVPVNLARYGLKEGRSEVRIPLREFKDDQGETLAFDQITGVQIVFEWADMAGELTLESLRFDSVWEEPVAPSAQAQELAEGLQVPEGFAVAPVADNLLQMTQIEFTPEGEMLVSLQGGRVWWYVDDDGDGQYDRRRLYAAGFTEIVGLLYDPEDGAVWIGGRGQLYRTADSDGNGVADERSLRIDGLPWGRHQNNGLTWNPDPDPFSGEPGHHWIYFGLGSTDDLVVGGELNATILRFPRDGQGQADLEVVSRGVRNAYDVVWAPVPVDLDNPDGETRWQLFASENGPDFNDAPDEVNHIRWGHHYGFPEQFGPVEDGVDGDPYSGPVYPVTAHASADGLAYITNPAWPPAYRTLYVSLFGEVFSPEPVGHIVERVTLHPETTAGGTTYRGEPSDFIVGLNRPLPLAVAPSGDLIVGDYATGVIYQVYYAGE